MNGYNLCDIAMDFKMQNKKRTSEVYGIQSIDGKDDKDILRDILRILNIEVPATPSYHFFGNEILNYVVNHCPDSCTVCIP